MTEWDAGDRCRIVEYDVNDFGSGGSLEGGQAVPATVKAVDGPFVQVYPGGTGPVCLFGPMYFGADDSWQSFNGAFRWRLVTGEAEAAAAAGEGN